MEKRMRDPPAGKDLLSVSILKRGGIENVCRQRGYGPCQGPVCSDF